MTTIRDVYDFLDDKIAELRAVKKENEASRNRYRLIMDDLCNMDTYNRSMVIGEVVSHMGKTAEECDRALEELTQALPDEVSRAVALGLESVRLGIKHDRARFSGERDIEVTRQKVQESQTRLDEKLKRLRKAEKAKHLFKEHVDFLLEMKAEEFKSLWEDLGYENFEAFYNRGRFKRWLDSFSYLKKRLEDTHGRYLTMIRWADDPLKPYIDGEIANPIDLLRSKKEVFDEHRSAEIAMDCERKLLKSAQAQLQKEETLSSSLTEKGILERYVSMIQDLVWKRDECFVALGDIFQPKEVRLSRHREGDLWSAEGAKALVSQRRAYVEMVKRHEAVIKDLEKTLDTLKASHRKLDYRINRIAHKPAKRVDLNSMGQAVDGVIARGRYNARWFEAQRTGALTSHQGIAHNDLMFWTALYLMMSSDESLADQADPEVRMMMDDLSHEMSQGAGLSDLEAEMTDLSLGEDVTAAVTAVSGGLLTDSIASMDALDSQITRELSGFESVMPSSGFGSGGNSDFGGSSDFGGGSSFGGSSSFDSGSSFGGGSSFDGGGSFGGGF